MEYANAMGKAAMGRTWENKIGQSKLFYPPKALKFGGIKQLPRKLIQRVFVAEYDQAVDRITDALGTWFIHPRNI